uniref:Uncharacterized protein n=1 Tax=Sphaerodactylus townsendi TaxID=933632 RepID=A0ACB8FYQ8_9SAUR
MVPEPAILTIFVLSRSKEHFDDSLIWSSTPRAKIAQAFWTRELTKHLEGWLDEINFEDFLTMVSNFRPIGVF